MDWTRAAALGRWRGFAAGARRYGALRNRVEPGHPHVTRLSHAIRSRLVSTEELVADLLASHPLEAVEKLVQELLWRDYWKGWMELRPDAWDAWRNEVARVRRTAPEGVLERADAVMAGRGGVAVMDRFARELVGTGYLHNHARMWWAGYWCHVERLPWALGADFFYRHLLDADPASNTLGWRWVAGLQTPGKAYLPRRSNLMRFCAPAWLDDPAGLERLDDDVVTAAPAAWEPAFTPRQWVPLPACPSVAGGRWGLWIHGEDLTPECTGLGALRPALVLTLLDASRVAALGLSASRLRGMEAGLSDARARAAAHFGCPVEHRGAPDGLGAALVGVAREHGLEGWVAMRPAVGPLGDALDEVEGALAGAGLGMAWCRRPWDERWWPLARAGFFPFWEKARRQLAARNLASPARGGPA